MGKSNWYDKREFLDFLEKKNDIVHIAEEVDPEWEVNGTTRIGLEEFGPAIVFDRIKGADLPMVTNLLGADRRFLWALGLEEWSQFNEEWMRRTEKLIPPKIIGTGPCQEETISGADINLNRICNVKWHQLDKSPYAGTLSISVTKDPDTGAQNVGIFRTI